MDKGGARRVSGTLTGLRNRHWCLGKGSPAGHVSPGPLFPFYPSSLPAPPGLPTEATCARTSQITCHDLVWHCDTHATCWQTAPDERLVLLSPLWPWPTAFLKPVRSAESGTSAGVSEQSEPLEQMPSIGEPGPEAIPAKDKAQTSFPLTPSSPSTGLEHRKDRAACARTKA